MKKWLWGLLAVIAIMLFFIYVFIPGKIQISTNSLIHCTPNQVSACFRSQARMATWWPEKPGADSVFVHEDSRYILKQPLTNGADIILVAKSGDSVLTNVFLMSQAKDSTAASWRAVIYTGLNPVKRIRQYYAAAAIKNNMKEVMESLHAYANNMENIYGITAVPEKVKFDFFMSQKKTFTHNPATSDIYGMIDAIRKFIKEKGALEMDHPMLSIMHTDSARYLAEVAVPVNLQLRDEGDFVLKWMLKGGNMLVAEVRGGNGKVDQSLKQFTQYMNDRRLTIMAIPFQSLVTDRRQQPDSNQWVTKLYYPVM